jgi:hypothetical protein
LHNIFRAAILDNMAITQEEWGQSDGKPCRECSRRSLRLPEGLCLSCYGQNQNKQAAAAEEKAETRALKRAFACGRITVSQLRKGELP